ncbi:isopenicillin N synthase family dioxygenase [Streptomyces sp. NPDC056161]|uniref:isopenicillin N synthase family dioxygenase n=1 Tax=Streptomyces sp. NPDC056161 TaxID=3345732 RepID=UPI0035E11554
MTHPERRTTTTSWHDQLPIIDLSAADRGRQARTLLHAQLHSAAHDIGFFQLVGHGVPRAERAALLTAVRAFFALPEADRLALDSAGSPHFRGYSRTGDEHTPGAHGRRDRLDLGAERPARAPGPGEPAYWWLEGPNQWPAALPELRTAALAWLDRLSGVARRLLHELLTAVGAPADFYDPLFGDRAHPRLSLVRHLGTASTGTASLGTASTGIASPGVTGRDGAGPGVSAGPSKDRGFLTLQLHAHGTAERRHAAPLPDDAFLVNLGARLEAATGGYLIAADHRAAAPPGTAERYSVPFFANPRLDAPVPPLPFPYAPYAPYAAEAPDSTGDPAAPPYAAYGHHELKGELRAHPLVARRHHRDLPAPA